MSKSDTKKSEIRDDSGKKKCITEVYARTVGFYRPVQDWNKGKTEEFKDRKTYKEDPKLDPEKPATCDKTEEYPPHSKGGV